MLNKCKFYLFIVVSFVVFPSVVLTGCGNDVITDQDIKMMTVEKVSESIKDPQVILVDVRSPKKYHVGHIPGAINIHLPKIKTRMPELATAKFIIVYSGGWRDRLGSAAVKKFLKLGYQNVSELRGGIEIWKDTGRKLSVPKTSKNSESTLPEKTE